MKYTRRKELQKILKKTDGFSAEHWKLLQDLFRTSGEPDEVFTELNWVLMQRRFKNIKWIKPAPYNKNLARTSSACAFRAN